MRTLKLGTRGSLLARTQSGQVAAAITAATGVAVQLVIIKTRGDRIQDKPLRDVGGKGLFTKEIEDAMLRDEVDFAVHSMKDMPTEDPPGLTIHTIPERVDPRDALVGSRLDDLPRGAVVGTGSIRRRLQLLAVRPDLDIRGIRGNVDTRIQKLRDGQYDAIVLAMAGLTRLDRQSEVDQALPTDTMVPAVGQGALAIQCRADDREVQSVLEAIHHEETAICVAAERSFLQAIDGGCSVPAACYAWMEDAMVVARGYYAPSDDGAGRTRQLKADTLHVRAMGRSLALDLLG